MPGKIFGRRRSLIYRGGKGAGLATDAPYIDGEKNEHGRAGLLNRKLRKKPRIMLSTMCVNDAIMRNSTEN